MLAEVWSDFLPPVHLWAGWTDRWTQIWDDSGASPRQERDAAATNSHLFVSLCVCVCNLAVICLIIPFRSMNFWWGKYGILLLGISELHFGNFGHHWTFHQVLILYNALVYGEDTWKTGDVPYSQTLACYHVKLVARFNLQYISMLALLGGERWEHVSMLTLCFSAATESR